MVIVIVVVVTEIGMVMGITYTEVTLLLLPSTRLSLVHEGTPARVDVLYDYYCTTTGSTEKLLVELPYRRIFLHTANPDIQAFKNTLSACLSGRIVTITLTSLDP